ncbi:MAG: prolipoprotein diacylglyceryl transferase [Chlorobi bacterium]|nr:prolipoprotein diacylglyceryl transferase [Chlorobiota bacterium]
MYYDQPTLLFYALAWLFLGFVLIYNYRKYDGRVFFAFLLIFAGFERFFGDLLKLNDRIFLFTTAQWISILLVAVSIIYYRWNVLTHSDFQGTNTMERSRFEHTRTLGF